MIKIKLSIAKGERDLELSILHNETLSSAIDRSLDGIVKNKEKIPDKFVTLVNGFVIDPKLWDFVKLNDSDNVLIAPKITGGDSGGLLKTALIIAATVYTGGTLAPALGLTTTIGGVTSLSIGGGLLVAGASIAASLLLNSLIPPPVPPGLDIGAGGDLGSSQMYSISGQSNVTRKLQTVPKVYGQHKIFPPLAANPYTELEADPDTGQLIQYFYAIYDFGLGPLDVGQIFIGDTPLSEFSDVTYNLVDLNKPETSEGYWDDALINTFKLYKGEVERDTVAVAINKNQNFLLPLSDYESTRNASPNVSNSPQEITITLANPQGLYAFSSTGARGSRTIDLDIFFSKVGEDVWHGFNDPTYTDSHINVGGSDFYAKINQSLHPPGVYTLGVYSGIWPLISEFTGFLFLGISYSANKYNHGLLKGATTIVLASDATLIGKYLRLNGKLVGKVISGTPHATPGYTTYTFDTPLTESFVLYTFVPDPNPPQFDSVVAPYNNLSPSGKVTGESLVIGRARITRAELNAVYSTFAFVPKELGSYKIRVTRIASFSQYTQSYQDALSWVGLSTRFDREPIITDKRHVFLEFRIRATNQLNGTIQNLSAVCKSILPVYDGMTWTKQATSNPAWVLADLLTGEVNKRPIDISRLHLDSLLEWSQFCDEIPTPPPSQDFTLPRFQTNFILDYSPTLQSLISQITNASQASLNIIDGKYGVLIDKLRTTPVQVFTPRNYSSFSSTRNYTKKPHAIKVSYIDPNADWEVRESLVYDTGYDENNSTEFDEVTSFACTNAEQAWRFGRYLLAQNRLRQENITITVDFENLVCTRGDYVQITQDAMKVGGTPARVKTISGNQITIDDAIETLPGTYGFVFRGSDGNIYTDTLTVINSTTFDLDGSNFPAVGDLIIIGLTGNIVLDCIVKSIEPGPDLTATLTLVEKADAIYTAESTDTLPEYSPQISPTIDAEFSPPNEVENLAIADNFYECSGAGLDYKVLLDWDIPDGAAYDVFEIWVNTGGGYNFSAITKESFYAYVADPADVGALHSFKVLAVSAAGKKLELGDVGEVSATVLRKTEPPLDVDALNTNITGEVIQLQWQRVDDCSIDKYLIRYSPNVDDTAFWERSVPLLEANRNQTMISTQARTGTYLIKAIDWEGNESANSAEAITTIPELFGLNIIEQTADFPTLAGVKVRTQIQSDSLLLTQKTVGGVDIAEYNDDGYYYFENFLDLGEIATVRLQSLIDAEGFSLEDLMSNWTQLDLLTTLSHARFSDWDTWIEYRATNNYDTISLWIPLSDVTSMTEGDIDEWTPWRKIATITDATGKIFEFRLKLDSLKVSVTPVVFNAVVKSDMPDRIDQYTNIYAPSSGYALSYSPSFMGPAPSPNVQISIDGASSGDFWSFDYKTLDGFYIRFFDKDSNPVARTFDAQIRGYGRKALAVI